MSKPLTHCISRFGGGGVDGGGGDDGVMMTLEVSHMTPEAAHVTPRPIRVCANRPLYKHISVQIRIVWTLLLLRIGSVRRRSVWTPLLWRSSRPSCGSEAARQAPFRAGVSGHTTTLAMMTLNRRSRGGVGDPSRVTFLVFASEPPSWICFWPPCGSEAVRQAPNR